MNLRYGVFSGDGDKVKRRRSISKERRKSSDKFDSPETKDDKKDEPLLSKIFRASRKKSRGSGDDSRENSVSPMRRGDQRSSREKRRDSSGSRIPFMSRASRQKSDLSKPPITPDNQSKKGRDKEGSNDKDNEESKSSHRSSSVEGRLEGNVEDKLTASKSGESGLQNSPFPSKEGLNSSGEGVKKQSGFHRNLQKANSVVQRQKSKEGRKSWLASNEKSDSQTSSSKSKSASSSYDSLDDLDSSASSKKEESKTQQETSGETKQKNDRRFSSDSSNLSFSNIFMKSQSHSKNKKQKDENESKDKHNSFYVSKIASKASSGDAAFDVNSGPHSLDSCLSNSRDEDEKLRKATSVDQVSLVSDNKIESGKRFVKKQDVKSESKSPKLTLRSISQQPSDGQSTSRISNLSRRDSSGDELATSSSKAIRKDASGKRHSTPSEDGSRAVPEFMRIHLNKVEKQSAAVIYQTDQENSTEIVSFKSDSSGSNVIHIESPQAKQTKTYEDEVITKRHSISIDGKTSLIKNNDHTGDSKASNQKTSFNISFDEKATSASEESAEESCDKVVLRKPLLRASSVSSSKKSEDQPELFKVFARRSFKIKDSDKNASDDEEECVGDDNEENDAKTTVSAPSVSQISSSPLQTSSTVTNIPLSRFTVGNPTVSFKPPNAVQTSKSPISATTSGSPIANNVINAIPVNRSVSSPTVNTDISSKSSNESPLSSSPVPKSNVVIVSSSNSNSSSPAQASGITLLKKTPETKSVIIKEGNTTSNDNSGNSTAENIPAVNSTPPSSSGFSSNIISGASRKCIAGPKPFVANVTNKTESASGQSPSPNVVKPVLTTRGSSSLLWPPRTQADENSSAGSNRTTPSPQPINVRKSPSPQPPIANQTNAASSGNSLNSSENARPVSQANPKDSLKSVNVGDVRRRFVGEGTESSQSVDKSTTPVNGNKSAPVLAEARNVAPAFTVTVRTQSVTSPPRSVQAPSSVSTNNSSLEKVKPQSSVDLPQGAKTQRSPSTGSVSEDWRELVRQRKEDRLKQTKTPDSEEILIEVSSKFFS